MSVRNIGRTVRDNEHDVRRVSPVVRVVGGAGSDAGSGRCQAGGAAKSVHSSVEGCRGDVAGGDAGGGAGVEPRPAVKAVATAALVSVRKAGDT